MKKRLVALFGFVALLAVIAVIFALVFLDSIVKKGVESVGPAVTQVNVSLADVNVSMLSGRGELQGLVIGNPEGFKTPSAIQMSSVDVSIDPGSVFSEKVIVRSIRVADPQITFEESLKGSNLSKILENVQSVAGKSENQKETQGTSKKLQVDELVISGGKINLSATILGGKSATVALPEIRLANLGQGPEGLTPAELTQRVLTELLKNATPAIAAQVGELGKGAVEIGKGAIENAEKIGKGAAEQLNKAKKGIGDLFKKD